MRERAVRERRVEHKYDNNFSRLSNGVECPQCNSSTDSEEEHGSILTVCTCCGWSESRELPDV
jgi:transcription elongation factor Elf1